VLARAAQHVFCLQYDAAIADLDLWPATTRAKMKANFASQIKADYSDFASRLAQPPSNKECRANSFKRLRRSMYTHDRLLSPLSLSKIRM
jgi:hypothetical protein